MTRIFFFASAVIIILYCSCNLKSNAEKEAIATDTATIAKGEKLFIQNCGSCHNFQHNGIGPALAGITKEAPVQWITHFIKNPKGLIDSGDSRAQKLFQQYHVVMPSFGAYNDNDIAAIVSFLNTHNTVVKKIEDNDSTSIKDPIPSKIAFSGLTGELKFLMQFPASSDSGKLPLARITKLYAQPSSGLSFVLDLRGKLYQLENNHPVEYMDMAKLEPRFINTPGLGTGFGSFAFHPDFAKNGLLYTTHAESISAVKDDFNFPDSIKGALQWVLTEWKTDHPGAVPFSGKPRELLRITMVTDMHGVQEISFNPLAKPGDNDYGLLYLGVGDGGAVENGYPFLTHNTQSVWGSVLRINPAGRNSKNGRYGIPAQNPFAADKNENTVKEIYAYGFRNPHRITWSNAGQMLVSNVGHGNIESLNWVNAGNDFGWPIREGNFAIHTFGNLNKVYPLPGNDSDYHISYPVAEFDHDEGKAICGGYEYTGNTIALLKGKYLFGDIPTGRLFYINVADIKQGKQAIVKEWKLTVNGKPQTLEQLCGSGRVDLHFGQDGKGDIYILTKADGKLYKIVGAATNKQVK
jgi:mono/diheme cytochrome c family protein/glucose/arabinose dehydrogenase